jgi:hypothetical protein
MENNGLSYWAQYFFAVGGTIGTLTGILSPIIGFCAGVLIVIWTLVQLSESRTVRNTIQARRLKKLVKLRAKAVALELTMRNNSTGLRGLHRANAVHLAAEQASTDLTKSDLVAEEAEKTRSALEKSLANLKD